MTVRTLGDDIPRMHPSAFVSEAAYVVGKVELGELASVWPGAVVRADSGRIRIGARTNVQDNSVVHADADAEIGEGVTIGHGVVCHGRSIGNGSLLGNGCVVNDGVRLGEMCLVAAGSVVTESMEVESFSILRGTPAKVIGKLRDRHKMLLQQAAEAYVKRIDRYKRSGLELIPRPQRRQVQE